LKNIIIGSSAAGISAAETLRREDPTCEIIMISDEPNPLYSRPLISYYLAGELPEERIYYRPPDFYERNRIEAHLGRRAVRVEPRANRVILDNGEELEYDNLLLANGASPTFPEIEGLDKAGVFGFRRLSDAKEMLAMLPQVKQAVVLGGGLVGLKAAVGLKARGVDVTVAVGSPHLLSPNGRCPGGRDLSRPPRGAWDQGRHGDGAGEDLGRWPGHGRIDGIR
jgi:NAD(P)H-nitrite reductase large subunit